MTTLLAIDAALRKTGLALLDGPRTLLRTARFTGERDNFHNSATGFVAELLWHTDAKVDVALVEWPPYTVKERDGRRVRDQARELGFACGAWVAACRACGIERVVTVEVSEWRKVVLGPLFKGAEQAKWAATVKANDYLSRHGVKEVSTDHEAEALCLGLWWQDVHGAAEMLPRGNRS